LFCCQRSPFFLHHLTLLISQLIDILNDRFGTEFKPGDQLFFDSIREDAVSDTYLREAAKANTMENFGYAFRKQLESLFINRMDQNEEITAKFMNEKEFQDAVGKYLLKTVYDQIRSEKAEVS
jgi:type I restriction enzyme, R subunit